MKFCSQKRSDLRVNKIHECFQLKRFKSQQNCTPCIWKYQLNIDPDFSIKSNIFLGFPYMFDRTGLDIAQGIYNFWFTFFSYFLHSVLMIFKKLLSFLNIYFKDWILCQKISVEDKVFPKSVIDIIKKLWNLLHYKHSVLWVFADSSQFPILPITKNQNF